MEDHIGEVECFMCGGWFTPNKAQWDSWGNSDRDFDPTDWECQQCERDEADALEEVERVITLRYL